jgi:tetratricopeptide (TPR) repeat protein
VRRALGELYHMRNDLQEAESLANTLGESRLLRRVALSVASHHFLMGQHEQTIISARRILATPDEDVEGQVQANYRLGMACLHQGAYQHAVDHFRQSIAPLTGDLQHERFGRVLITAVAARCFLAWSLAEIGKFDEGIAIGAEGIRIAEAANHPASLGGAYIGAGYPYLRRGDLPQALPLLERALHICYEAGMTLNFPTVAFPLGAAYTLAGRIDDAVQLLTQAMQQAIAIGRMSSQPLRIACLGEAHLQADHPEKAAHLLECALTLARTQKEWGWEAYILRLYGDLVMHRKFSDPGQAEIYYQQALALANELGMRPLQAHCHRGLGTLYRQAGQPEQARTELSVAIEMYRDMEMTFWLPETEAALVALEGQ